MNVSESNQSGTEIESGSESISESENCSDGSLRDVPRAPTQQEIIDGLLARYPPEEEDELDNQSQGTEESDSVSDEGIRDWEDGMKEKRINEEKLQKQKQMAQPERKERNKLKRKKEAENRERYHHREEESKRRRPKGVKTLPSAAVTTAPSQESVGTVPIARRSSSMQSVDTGRAVSPALPRLREILPWPPPVMPIEPASGPEASYQSRTQRYDIQHEATNAQDRARASLPPNYYWIKHGIPSSEPEPDNLADMVPPDILHLGSIQAKAQGKPLANVVRDLMNKQKAYTRSQSTHPSSEVPHVQQRAGHDTQSQLSTSQGLQGAFTFNLPSSEKAKPQAPSKISIRAGHEKVEVKAKSNPPSASVINQPLPTWEYQPHGSTAMASHIETLTGLNQRFTPTFPQAGHTGSQPTIQYDPTEPNSLFHYFEPQGPVATPLLENSQSQTGGTWNSILPSHGLSTFLYQQSYGYPEQKSNQFESGATAGPSQEMNMTQYTGPPQQMNTSPHVGRDVASSSALGLQHAPQPTSTAATIGPVAYNPSSVPQELIVSHGQQATGSLPTSGYVLPSQEVNSFTMQGTGPIYPPEAYAFPFDSHMDPPQQASSWSMHGTNPILHQQTRTFPFESYVPPSSQAGRENFQTPRTAPPRQTFNSTPRGPFLDQSEELMDSSLPSDDPNPGDPNHRTSCLATWQGPQNDPLNELDRNEVDLLVKTPPVNPRSLTWGYTSSRVAKENTE